MENTEETIKLIEDNYKASALTVEICNFMDSLWQHIKDNNLSPSQKMQLLQDIAEKKVSIEFQGLISDAEMAGLIVASFKCVKEVHKFIQTGEKLC